MSDVKDNKKKILSLKVDNNIKIDLTETNFVLKKNNVKVDENNFQESLDKQINLLKNANFKIAKEEEQEETTEKELNESFEEIKLDDNISLERKKRNETIEKIKLHLISEDDASGGNNNSIEFGRGKKVYSTGEKKFLREGKKNINFTKKQKILNIKLFDNISILDLASALEIKIQKLFSILKKNNILFKDKFDLLSVDIAEFIIHDLGHNVIIENKSSDLVNITKIGSKFEKRSPVVAVVGHVDHGKTTLLDTIRKTNLTVKEAGGITQSIGAYEIKYKNENITFIDTPGHAAFFEMRKRSILIADIIILVVAADDGIMPQTLEIINSLKSKEIPVIVAINKIDKKNANLAKTEEMLMNHGIVSEKFGGDYIFVPISALNNENIDQLFDAILLQSEMLELTTYVDGNANGFILESKIDKNIGVVTSLILKNGLMENGDFILSGTSFGKIKRISSDKNEILKNTKASQPVEILGFNKPPLPGDEFFVFKTENEVKDIILKRIEKEKEKELNEKSVDRLALFKNQENEIKKLKIILKADRIGAIEAIKSSLKEKFQDKINIIFSNVGNVNESDISLAFTTSSKIIAFDVKLDKSSLLKEIERQKIDFRQYNIIYKLLEDIELILDDRKDKPYEEEILGSAEVREIFILSKRQRVAGCKVRSGVINKKSKIRILRNGKLLHENAILSMKNFKTEVTETKAGYECGIILKNYSLFEVGDFIESYIVK